MSSEITIHSPLTGAAGAGESLRHQSGLDEHICQHVPSPTACERQHFTAQPELRLTKHNTVVRGI